MNTPPRRIPLSSSIIPQPVAVRLYNLFPDDKAKKWFRPDYEQTLLKRVCLQIVILTEDTPTILYSNTSADDKSVRPCWQHLNECIDMERLTIDEYDSMKLRFSIDSDSATDQDFFLEMPIHPSKLLRIGAVPPNLPINCAVVQFSDDSIRVSPHHYQLLLASKQEGVVIDKSCSLEDSRFFEDDVFRTLDQVTPVRQSSLLEQDDENQATPVAIKKKKKKTVAHAIADSDNQQLVFECKDRQLENAELQQLIEQESAALEQEMADLLQRDKTLLTDRMDEITKIEEKETAQVCAATRQELLACQKTAFLLEAERIRLVRELFIIFPVTIQMTDPEQRYFIRGLEIPSNLTTSSVVSEEELSAALGYLCQLVQMLSKYLGVQLRYRLYSNASRSAVQDDRGHVFPLYYSSRTADRDQLEHAFRLLDRNVECICKAREIRGVSSVLHILAKVKRIYEAVIDGY